MSTQPVSYENLVDLRTEPLAYATIVSVVCALLSIILRAWAQWGTECAWSPILIAAWCLVAADGSLNLVLLRYGFAAEGRNISPELIPVMFKTGYAVGTIYAFVLGFAKLSILQLYLKIFKVHSARRWIILLAGVSIVAAVANSLTVMLHCSPVRRAWGETSTGSCIDLNNVFAGFSVLNMVLDIIIPIVPACGVAKLHKDVSKRVLAILMFFLGSAVIVASAIRLSIIVQPEFRHPVWRFPPSRPTARLTTWSIIEASTAVVSSCLPLLRPLARKVKVLRSSLGEGESTRALNNSGSSYKEDEDKSHNDSHTESSHK